MFRIIPGKNAKSLSDDLYEKLFDYMGGNVRAYNEEETPIPWDADVDIQNGRFILTGGVGPSDYGYCQCSVPLSDAGKTYFIEIHDADSDDLDDIMDYGWRVREV